LALGFALMLVPGLMAQSATSSEPEPVASVDLERYEGRWYEFARIPNRFQEQCSANTTADYSLLENGRVEVVNRCVKSDGSVDEARGLAKIEDSETNARLKVSFVRLAGLNLFWGDYWIIGLGENYEYAVVGAPDRRYGWLLTREPEVSEELMDEMFFTLESNGYRHTDFAITRQEW
jgi:apolipoprotein D and lipocalin family protein